MPYNVLMVPTFRDAGPFDNQRTYRLTTQLANDGSNIALVMTNAADVLIALEAMSWDQIPVYELRIEIPTASAAANIAANNNVEAFIRTTLNTSLAKSSFSVPAWDDAVYDKASNGLLSAAFVAQAENLEALLVDVKTGEAFNVEFAQSRGIKRGQRLVK